jgi:hypothetical protein
LGSTLYLVLLEYETMIYKNFEIFTHADKKDVYLCDMMACSRMRHFKSLHAAKCFITRYMVPAYAAGSYRKV